MIDEKLDKDRPYDGQPHTLYGERGAKTVDGLTMRDISDCFVRAWILAHPCWNSDGTRNEANSALYAKYEEDPLSITHEDVYKADGTPGVDPIAMAQNLGCEIEKMMGIFPNCKLTPSSVSPATEFVQ